MSNQKKQTTQPKQPQLVGTDKPYVRYQIASAQNAADLEMEVCKFIKLGWLPMGGVNRYANQYLQAIYLP